MQNDEPSPADRELPAQMRQELALFFANQFRLGIDRTNTLLGAWVSALLLILFASILPVAGKLERIEVAKSRAAKAWGQLQHLTRQSDTVRNRIVNRGSDEVSSRDTLRLRDLQADIARLQYDTAAARRGIDSIAHDIAHIPTPIGTLPVSYYYLAVIWIVLLIVLLALFLYKRVLLVSILVRTVMIDPAGELVMPGRGAWAPFWLAPLPKIRRGAGSSDAVPDEEELRRFLGWRRDEKWRERLLYAGLAMLLVAYAGVAYLAIRVSDVDYPIARVDVPSAQVSTEGRRKATAEEMRRISISSYDPQAAVNMTVLVSTLLIAVLVLYINILRVPLHVGGYPERVLSISRRRRRFLRASAWALGLGVVYALLPRRYPFHYLAAGKPRFRREESVGQMERLARLFAGRFGIHKTSRAVHYVNRAGWVIGGIAPAPASMTPLALDTVVELLQAPLPAGDAVEAATPPSGVKSPAEAVVADAAATTEERSSRGLKRRQRLKRAVPHIPAQRRGPLAEYAALMLLHDGDIDGAIKVLWSAIEYDAAFKKNWGGRPDRRLFELLAGLAVRFSRPTDILRLDGYVAREWPRDPLNERRSVWRAASSRWRSRWSGKRFPWNPPYEKGEDDAA